MNRHTGDTRSDRDGLKPDGLSPLVHQWPDEAPPAWLDANIRAAAHDAARVAGQKAAREAAAAGDGETGHDGKGRSAAPLRWNRWLPLGGTLATAVLAVLLVTARPGGERVTDSAEREAPAGQRGSPAASETSATPGTPAAPGASGAAGPLTTPGTPPAPSTAPAREPRTAARESEARTARPATPAARSSTPAAKPVTPVAEPAAPIGRPAPPVTEPAAPIDRPAPPPSVSQPAERAAQAAPAVPPAPAGSPRPSTFAGAARQRQDAHHEDTTRSSERRFEQQSAAPAASVADGAARTEPPLPDSGEACVRLLESLSRDRRSDEGQRMLTRCRERFPDQPIPPSLEREFGGR